MQLGGDGTTRFAREPNSTTANAEFVQKFIFENFSELKRGDTIVLKTKINIKPSEEMFPCIPLLIYLHRPEELETTPFIMM